MAPDLIHTRNARNDERIVLERSARKSQGRHEPELKETNHENLERRGAPKQSVVALDRRPAGGGRHRGAADGTLPGSKRQRRGSDVLTRRPARDDSLPCRAFRRWKTDGRSPGSGRQSSGPRGNAGGHGRRIWTLAGKYPAGQGAWCG